MAIYTNNAQAGQKYECGYVADDGETYSIIQSGQHIDALPDYQVSAGDFPAFPKRWKPRLLHGVQVNAGRDRRASIVVPRQTSFDPATNHQDWTDIQEFEIPGLGVFKVTGRTGEQRTIAAPLWDGVPTPAQGRVQVLYTSDDIVDTGNSTEKVKYLITTNRQHAALLAADPPMGQYKQLPRRIVPRHYGLLGDVLTGSDKKRTMIEIDPESSIWKSDVPYTFNFGDTGSPKNFTVTGRKSESETKGAQPLIITIL